ncbi:MAG: DUF4026 domain-containing protein [Firmicutes bacterium]|jgi:hypothetical protein|nr:DUF4026 domain-containing protein [Bacillota bacterium]
MKEKSFMLGIPLEEKDILNPNDVLDRLKGAEGIEIRTSFLEDGKMVVQADVLGDTYTMEAWPEEFTVPEFYRVQHIFPDLDFKALKTAKCVLVTSMEFGDDPLASYHAQLKLLDAMLPDKLGVLDDSSEKILSPMWVSLQAASQIHPSPNYIFTVQAVGGEDGRVWLHTHGLSRCGITELEIIDSNANTYQSHYHVISNLASRLLEMERLEPKAPLFLGRLSNRVDLVVTLVPWKEAVSLYDNNMLGGLNDRQEGHNGDTSCIFVYKNERAFKKGKYQPVSIHDKLLAENPLYWLSNEETDRMKALAAERISYMTRAWKDGNVQILIKVGLQVDPQYRDETNEREHIWFELLDLCEDGTHFEARLTQEPYYIAGLHEGATGRYGFEEITDWLIFAPEYRISPDDVYLMEAFPTAYNDELN